MQENQKNVINRKRKEAPIMNVFSGARMRWIPDPPCGSTSRNMGLNVITLFDYLPYLLPPLIQ